MFVLCIIKGLTVIISSEISKFFRAIKQDSRINPIHISLFMAVIQRWEIDGFKTPICVFSHELMTLAKISSTRTYHRTIRELHEYGYLNYIPSFNRLTGSLIYIF